MSHRLSALIGLLVIVLVGCGRDDRPSPASVPPAESPDAAGGAPPPPPPPPAPVGDTPDAPAFEDPDDQPEMPADPEMAVPPEHNDVQPGMAPEAGDGMRRLEGAEAEMAGEPAAPDTPTLLARAREALGQGRWQEGMALLRAAAVAEEEAAEEVLDTLRWSPALQRPMLVTRWGIAVLSGIPAGTPQRGQMGRGHAPQPHAHGAGGQRMPPGRHPVHPGGHQHQPPHAGGHPGAGREGAPAPGAGGPLEFWHHVVGLPLAQGLERLVAEGTFGHWLVVDHSAPQRHAAGAAGEHRHDEFGAAQHGMGAPGHGSSSLQGIATTQASDLNDAKRWAADNEIDVLLTVAMAIAPGSFRGVPQTTLTVKIYDVARDDELWSSRPLNSRRVQAALAGARSDGNPAQEFLESLGKYVKQNLRLQEMPALDAAVVARRAQSLAAQEHRDPLPALLELRYYAAEGLLDEPALQEHYATILGPQDGAALSAGDVEQRRQVVEALLR